MNSVYLDVKDYIYGIDVLDFGCGKIHALADILNKNGFNCSYYDLFYYPEFPNLLFDTIIMIEVFEHLEEPYNVLLNLKKYLKKSGRVIFQTKVYPDNLDNWWYLRDTTHVSFIKNETILKWCEQLGYKVVGISRDIFILECIN